MSSAALGPLSLDWLIDPLPVSDFFRAYWEKQPLLVSRERSDYFLDLPGLDDVDELITATASARMRSTEDELIVRGDHNGTSAQRTVQLDANGVPDIQDIYRAYHAGYSIVVNAVHRRSAAVALLCRALETAVHHRIGANLYLTPRNGQGFAPHVDTHDVLILQLHGTKEWHIGNPSHDLPLVSSQRDRVRSLDDPRNLTLRPGDTLYLPRGFPHEAVTGPSSSLHLTVGIHAYRWVDLMVEALDLLAEEQVELRTALPPGFLDTPLDAAHAAKLGDALALALAGGTLTGRAKARLGSRLLKSSKAAGRGHFRAVDAIHGLTEDSVVVRVPGHLCRVQSTGENAVIEFAGNYVAGPLSLEPTLNFVVERRRFAVRELPGQLSIGDKVELVSRLISEGLLECPDDSKEGEV